MKIKLNSSNAVQKEQLFEFIWTNPKSTTGDHMWQSQVEIEHYSVAYFDRITVFEGL